MKSLFILIVCLSTAMLHGQPSETYLCGNGKFALELGQCINKANSYIKQGQKCEAISHLLPFAFDDTYGKNEAYQMTIDLLRSIYSKKDLIVELKNGLNSIRLVKQYDTQFGETSYLSITFFGNEIILPDSYYWLGAPAGKSSVNRSEINVCESIDRSRNKIKSTFLAKLTE